MPWRNASRLDETVIGTFIFVFETVKGYPGQQISNLFSVSWYGVSWWRSRGNMNLIDFLQSYIIDYFKHFSQTYSFINSTFEEKLKATEFMAVG